MGNALINAGGLDGVTAWAGSCAISIDETVMGGPGRAVIRGDGAGGQNGILLQSAQVAAAAGDTWEFYTGAASNLPDQHVYAQWVDATHGNVVSLVPLTKVAAGVGPARRGLPTSFDRWYARLVAPAGAANVSLATAVGGAGQATLALLKPYAAPAPLTARPTLWDPGGHNNPDLQLPAWPSSLPPFQADGLAQPIANAKAWAGDAGIPVREDLYRSLHFEYRARMRLDLEAQDALDQFFTSQRDPFYVVRPDTDQLCIADWLADGAPKPVSNAGLYSIVEVGLHLEVA